MFDSKAVEGLLYRIIEYENWIQRETESYQIEQELIPPGYLNVFAQNKDAYLFYRHSLVYLLKNIREESGVYSELLDLTYQAVGCESVDKSQFKSFVDLLYRKFEVRSNNAYQYSNLFPKLGMQKLELNYVSLSAYQNKYEIEEVLIYIAVLRKVISNNIFDTELKNLRDKSGKLRKGATVDYILSGLCSFPTLKKTVSMAYIPKIRNSFGHNDFVIKDGLLFNLDNELLATNSDFIEAFYSIQELHNAIIWAISYFELSENIEQYFDCGVLSIGYYYNKEIEMPEIQLCQLWCFFQNDSEKEWLNKVQVFMEHQMITTIITDTCTISGKILPEISYWIKIVKNFKEIQVKVIPIVPYIGLETITIDINNEKYQPIGEPYSSRVSVEVIEL